MEPYYLIAPIAILGAIGYSIWAARRIKQRVATAGIEAVLTEQWGASFRLAPGEQLRDFHMGQLYEGPAIPELADSTAAKAGRFVKSIVGGITYHHVQVYVGLTTHGRLVVGRNGQHGSDDHGVRPHSEWIPGGPIVFANELGLDPGPSPKMDNGYRGRMVFVMFGTVPGARLPVWLDERAAGAIATWRTAGRAAAVYPPPN
jgi:hypothetical protein